MTIHTAMLTFEQYITEGQTATSRKLARGKIGKRRPSAVRQAISRAMKGRSNFQGKRHSDSAKQRIGDSRGHDDRIDGRKWIANKRSGKTFRKYRLPDSDYRFGR